MKTYIHQLKDWPHFKWDNESLLLILGKVRNLQGKLTGRMESLGFDLRNDASLQILTLEILKSSEIEGEMLQPDQVRSSIARRLGMDIAGLVPSDRNVEGVVEMMLDATQQYEQPLTVERLFNWHTSLFPFDTKAQGKITVGDWRKDTSPMQVVSGAMGKEHVHFEAPATEKIDTEMKQFLDWFNTEEKLDPVLKAAIAHLWFVTVHPFDDGNGRIARAITDMMLARADETSQRFYSMSAQIRLERKGYYDILERTQKGSLNITNWLNWFLNCLLNALNATESKLGSVLFKSHFWKTHATTNLNDRQIVMLNKILDGFEGKLTSSKWAKITKCSADTALRDIQDLITKDILKKEEGGGRSTSYEVKEM